MGSITDALKAKGATGSNIAECIETLPSGGSGGSGGATIQVIDVAVSSTLEDGATRPTYSVESVSSDLSDIIAAAENGTTLMAKIAIADGITGNLITTAFLFMGQYSSYSYDGNEYKNINFDGVGFEFRGASVVGLARQLSLSSSGNAYTETTIS